MPVYLPNGFIYSRDTEREYGAPKAIYDKAWHVKDRKRVIMGDVKDIMWHNKTVYGFRRGLANEPYYYICTYAEDCSNTQHLTETDFIHMLEEKGLPAYESGKARTYDELLRDQSYQ